jgi:hypothetical protein
VQTHSSHSKDTVATKHRREAVATALSTWDRWRICALQHCPPLQFYHSQLHVYQDVAIATCGSA